ncbi:MAG: GNAT family N-acetyltransferase [Deltaproteobacteria bacterium HGW-Deltaproteobacteria-6]|jgi:acyl-CoA hydrolase|nr:MAG: GNAT family N-acetyltransferase [Deltaproteobacteria bacterium HGW-Deltaproteobacteria-6]
MPNRITGLGSDFSSKIINTDQVLDKIKPGQKIFVSSGVAAPGKVLAAIAGSEARNIRDLEIIQLITLGNYLTAQKDYRQYRLKTFNIGESISKEIAEGKVDFIPANLMELPYIFLSGAVAVDVAIIQTSMPGENGFVSLGVSIDVANVVIKQASLVIAEVNPNMPVTLGETFLHISSFDYVVESDLPLIERENKPYDAIVDRIGWNISNLIEDGATVVLHVGKIFTAVADHLKGKKNLGIVTHVISDWVIDLINSGAISLDRSRYNGGLVTASYCYGSRALYEYVDRNPVFEFYPIARLSNPFVVRRIKSLISIMNVKKIDISGESVIFHSGDNLLTGYESKLNFAVAATISKRGKAIVALNSVDKQGRSNIVIKHDCDIDNPHSTLGVVKYIATEYGVANLFGKSIRERVIAMIDIAHPDHREDLLAQAKALNYVYADQIYVARHAANYPAGLETRKSLRDGLEIKIRPIKPSDEDMMRRLFYNFSDESKYFRYFASKPVMPHKEMQSYVSIDYETILSVVAIVEKGRNERIIGEARYAYDKNADAYEVAFIVDEEFQGKGIASFMFNYLVKIARDRGISCFIAYVLPRNEAMLKVFEKAKIETTRSYDSDALALSFNLAAQNNASEVAAGQDHKGKAPSHV